MIQLQSAADDVDSTTLNCFVIANDNFFQNNVRIFREEAAPLVRLAARQRQIAELERDAGVSFQNSVEAGGVEDRGSDPRTLQHQRAAGLSHVEIASLTKRGLGDRVVHTQHIVAGSEINRVVGLVLIRRLNRRSQAAGITIGDIRVDREHSEQLARFQRLDRWRSVRLLGSRLTAATSLTP